MNNKTGELFKSLKNRSQLVFCVFGICVLVYIIAISFDFAQVALLQKFAAGLWVSDSEILANVVRQNLISTVDFIAYVVSGIVFLVWLHRAHRNLLSLNVSGLRFTPGWAVGWFFVPIMNIFRPYQVVSEVFRASDPGRQMTDSTTWRSSPFPLIVGCWWALFLISSLVWGLLSRLAFTREEVGHLIASTYAYIGSEAFDIIGIVVTILMVKKISEFQERKNKLIHNMMLV